MGPDNGTDVGDGGCSGCLLGGQRLAATFEALPAGGVDGQDRADRGVELLNFGADSLVGYRHGQGQADAAASTGTTAAVPRSLCPPFVGTEKPGLHKRGPGLPTKRLLTW